MNEQIIYIQLDFGADCISNINRFNIKNKDLFNPKEIEKEIVRLIRLNRPIYEHDNKHGDWYDHIRILAKKYMEDIYDKFDIVIHEPGVIDNFDFCIEFPVLILSEWSKLKIGYLEEGKERFNYYNTLFGTGILIE